jgi:hypothetical protein
MFNWIARVTSHIHKHGKDWKHMLHQAGRGFSSLAHRANNTLESSGMYSKETADRGRQVIGGVKEGVKSAVNLIDQLTVCDAEFIRLFFLSP